MRLADRVIEDIAMRLGKLGDSFGDRHHAWDANKALDDVDSLSKVEELSDLTGKDIDCWDLQQRSEFVSFMEDLSGRQGVRGFFKAPARRRYYRRYGRPFTDNFGHRRYPRSLGLIRMCSLSLSWCCASRRYSGCWLPIAFCTMHSRNVVACLSLLCVRKRMVRAAHQSLRVGGH